jgi:hypothetical protein
VFSPAIIERDSKKAIPIMLSERMVARLSALQYRADAKWGVCIDPYSGIYWFDEMPEIDAMSEDWEEMRMVFRMSWIRQQLWEGTVLNASDRQLWDAVLRLVPDWPLFRRLSLTNEQRAAWQEVEWERQQEGGLS